MYVNVRYRRILSTSTTTLNFQNERDLHHKWCKIQVTRLNLPNIRHIGPLFVHFEAI